MTGRYPPFVIPEGTSYPDAIRHTLQQRWPGVDFRFNHPPAATRRTPGLVYGLGGSEVDPWQDAVDLANAIGLQLSRRGNRVTAYVPWRERLAMVRWRLTGPLRRARARRAARRNPAPEWWSEDPRPDYDDE